jgi:putative heme iron utilization protein
MADAALEAARLILRRRWAALATVDDATPAVSMVAYAPEPDLEGLLMYLSGLAAHTRALRAAPAAALAISAPDPGEDDPQLLPRVSLTGTVAALERSTPRFEAAWEAYTDRLPWAAPRLMLGDFVLFRFVPERARFVGGFGRAHSLGFEEIRRAFEAPAD